MNPQISQIRTDEENLCSARICEICGSNAFRGPTFAVAREPGAAMMRAS
jgi:hypothetical protein